MEKYLPQNQRNQQCGDKTSEKLLGWNGYADTRSYKLRDAKWDLESEQCTALTVSQIHQWHEEGATMHNAVILKYDAHRTPSMSTHVRVNMCVETNVCVL